MRLNSERKKERKSENATQLVAVSSAQEHGRGAPLSRQGLLLQTVGTLARKFVLAGPSAQVVEMNRGGLREQEPDSYEIRKPFLLSKEAPFGNIWKCTAQNSENERQRVCEHGLNTACSSV